VFYKDEIDFEGKRFGFHL